MLQSLSEGRTPAELAVTFGIAESELQRRLSILFSRMGAASPRDAIAAACRRGLIPAAPGLGA